MNNQKAIRVLHLVGEDLRKQADDYKITHPDSIEHATIALALRDIVVALAHVELELAKEDSERHREENA